MRLKISYKRSRQVICLLVLLSLPLFSWSNDYGALYKKANEQYKKAQYQDAVKSYSQILDAGCQDEAVYFNLGNAYFKLGDIPSALLNYEKAHKLAPGDDDVNFNIYFANSKTADKVEPEPEFFVTQWWHSIMLSFSVNTLSILSCPVFYDRVWLIGALPVYPYYFCSKSCRSISACRCFLQDCYLFLLQTGRSIILTTITRRSFLVVLLM